MADSPIPGGLREEIARTLQPVRPLASPTRRVARLLPIAGLLLVGVPVVIGLRYDAAVVGAVRLWVASAFQVALAFAVLVSALHESIPGRLPALRRPAIVAGLGSLFMLTLTGVTFLASPTQVPPRQETLYFVGCLTQPFVLGLLPLGAMGLLIRRGIAARPVVAGAMAGLGCGLLTDSAWRLCCQVSDPAHVLTTHAAAILALSTAGALIGFAMSARRRRPVPDRPDLTKGIVRRLLQLAAFVLGQGVILFLTSGQTNWIMAWVYLGSYVVLIAANAAILLPRDPGLIAERGRIEKNTRGWDKVLMIPLLVFGLGTLAVAGLDRRFGWTPTIGWGPPVAGLAFYVLGFGLVSWAMACNRFFSSVVRIQEDRGHAVASGGPYAFVRHPGYLGMTASILGVAVLLGSLWALVPAGLYVATMTMRTALEDRMLSAELPGYRDYAKRVRHRLIPGIW